MLTTKNQQLAPRDPPDWHRLVSNTLCASRISFLGPIGAVLNLAGKLLPPGVAVGGAWWDGVDGIAEVAVGAFELTSDPRLPTFHCRNPGTINPRWIVPHVLLVPTFQIRYPIVLFVEMESDDGAFRHFDTLFKKLRTYF